MNNSSYQIILFYKYVRILDTETVVSWQREICERLGLKGRCIVADEGINATFEGTKENISEYEKELEKDERFKDIHFKLSSGNGNAFPKLSIKIRKEIVSLNLGTCDIDPNKITGIHLKPEELHEWIKNGREFYIIDMRNVYEHKVGHFIGSILPSIENFRDLPKIINKIAYLKNKTVLTVCTGGVRCEKASGFLLIQGFSDVYQLDGGIVSYMEKYPNEDFTGKLYVFDARVTIGFYTNDTQHEIIGKCDICYEQSENYVNCVNPVCHRHFLACVKCFNNVGGNVFCPGGCVLSRHGRSIKEGLRKISPVEANLVE